MSKFLNEAGVAYLWAKIKTLVTTTKNTVGDYTINSKKISSNPTLTKEDLELGNVTNTKQIPYTEKGAAGGVAELDLLGKLRSNVLPTFKTINGQSLLGEGNIQFDIDLIKIVTALPSTGEANKIYLVRNPTSTDTQNIYGLKQSLKK